VSVPVDMQSAISLGDVDEVQAILTRTPKLSTHRFKNASKELQTPLNAACLIGNLAIVKLLLDNGASADLTFQDAKRRFPLQCAVESQSVPLVKEMLEGGILSESYLRIMLREKSSTGQTCLHLAARYTSAAVLNMLLKALPQDNEELRAAQLNALQDSCGMTPLMIASASGAIDCVSALLQAKAAVDVQQGAGLSGDGKGRTALVVASIEGHVDVVKALLANGANPDIPDALGDTALIWAEMMEHDAVAEMLGGKVPAAPSAADHTEADASAANADAPELPQPASVDEEKVPALE